MKYTFTVLLLALLPIYSNGQQSLEFNISAGYTFIDLDKVVEEDEVPGTILKDWDQFTYGIGIQYITELSDKISIGGELMYQYWYWYQVRVPFPITRAYDVDATKITPFIRLGNSDQLKFDFGPQFNFTDGVSFGLLASANYYIPISDQLDIPIKIRLDLLDNIVLTTPTSLSFGIRYNL
ncbi:MAG: hypothetical protein HKO56_07825 [Bacteroidia bacterium]|nr:hypothetical protein [Bacteroidia bacterium]NNM16549.1 hypothetical protein [Bacteroidia bacterium]